jgi:hypothetical protein
MKKLLSNFKKDRKGGASVAIAVMMAMIIAVSFIQNILIWGQVVASEDKERFDETIEISQIYFVYNGTGSEIDIVVIVENTGSVTAHIVALYIEPFDPAFDTVRYGVEDGIDFYLDPAATKDVLPAETFINIMDPKMDPYDDFIVSVHTERGNSISKPYRLETSPPLPEWFAESANPLVFLPGASEVEYGNTTLTMSIWNKANIDINVSQIIVTTIVLSGGASPKVQVIECNYTSISGEQLVMIEEVPSTYVNTDGIRIELVSDHNWVVGQFVYIFNS